MAKLPPKLNFERLRAEVEKLHPIGERLRAELHPVGKRVRANLAAKRPPPKKAKRSRRALREQIEELVRGEYPRGAPARSAANPNRKLLAHMRPVLNRRRIHASNTTLLRALGRRRDPKKKPIK